MATNELEQISQYVGQILIPRINYVDLLVKQGRPFAALVGLRSLIQVLETDNKEEREQARMWLSRIDAVRRIQATGSASMYARYNTEALRNRAANQLCDELSAEIWIFLHRKGYFSLTGFGRFHDPSGGRKSQ